MKLNSDFKNIKNCDYHESVDISKYSTIKLKSIGNIAIVKTVESLIQTLKLLKRKKINYQVVGWGANQVFVNTENAVLIKLNFDFNREEYKSYCQEYRFPASAPLSFLTSLATKYGLKGWEVFTGIPASVGGAVFMNAGTALGEIGSFVKSVKILNQNLEVEEVLLNSSSFSYRENHFLKPGEIILEACLFHGGEDEKVKSTIKDYLTYRKTTQPLATKNCGCVFKNYDEKHKAGQFIDVCGLKGFGFNGLKVSKQHANFIENTKEAGSKDFLDIIDVLKYELELFSGIEFELEAKVY